MSVIGRLGMNGLWTSKFQTIDGWSRGAGDLSHQATEIWFLDGI